MPQITITLDLPPEALRDLFNSYGASSVKVKEGTIRARPTEPKLGQYRPGQGRGFTPQLPMALDMYQRKAGDRDGAIGRGRPPALNVVGMNSAWSLYNKGHSIPEIAASFEGVCGLETIRRLITNIKTTKESR